MLSNTTFLIFVVLVLWLKQVVLTHCFKLISFYIYICCFIILYFIIIVWPYPILVQLEAQSPRLAFPPDRIPCLQRCSWTFCSTYPINREKTKTTVCVTNDERWNSICVVNKYMQYSKHWSNVTSQLTLRDNVIGPYDIYLLRNDSPVN